MRISHSSLFAKVEELMSAENLPLLVQTDAKDAAAAYGATTTEFYNMSEESRLQSNSVEQNEPEHGYDLVELSDNMHDITGALLQQSQKFVLRPYNVFLCVIGWRKFNVFRYERICSVLGTLWPCVVFILLLVSCAIQILLCFSRDSIPFQHNTITCSNHIISSFILLDVLLVATYLYGLIIFRFLQPENLSGMIQKTFCLIEGRSSKKLAGSMLFFLLLGSTWIIFSFGVSLVRIFTHHLDQNVDLEFLKEYSNMSDFVKVVMLGIAQFSFITFDVAYAAIVVNYALHCQLMVYLLDNICTRLMTKAWTIDQAITEINVVRSCLTKLNGHLSRATGAIMFLFLYSSVSSLYSLNQLESNDDDIVILAVTGILSTIQWSIWLLIPLLQAAHVTYTGSKLQETALEIRSRPFQYKSTPQIDLDSLVIYCCNVQMKAKLLSVPISPQLVVGGGFVLGFTLFMVLKFDNFAWAPWL